ncbi:MAG: ATP-binding response regulator, partial [Nannocystaceae bacterium]
RDTGIGIEAHRISGLFEPFAGVLDNQRKGTGLGLAICRELCGLMGGTIGAESVVGQGSTFWVEIPLTYANKAPGVDLRTPIPQGTPELHILVAEDNPVNQRIMELVIAKLGYSLKVVNNGQEAIDAVCSQRYDAILMDINMPLVDGHEATQKIRELEAEKDYHTPIIALTANAMSEERERCVAVGMDAYITKPIEIQHLARVLAKQIFRLP